MIKEKYEITGPIKENYSYWVLVLVKKIKPKWKVETLISFYTLFIMDFTLSFICTTINISLHWKCKTISIRCKYLALLCRKVYWQRKHRTRNANDSFSFSCDVCITKRDYVCSTHIHLMVLLGSKSIRFRINFQISHVSYLTNN